MILSVLDRVVEARQHPVPVDSALAQPFQREQKSPNFPGRTGIMEDEEELYRFPSLFAGLGFKEIWNLRLPKHLCIN